MRAKPMNIVLVGFKSCGKSSTGKALAKLMGTPFTDTDLLMESAFAASGEEPLSCPQIYARRGATFMRELENRILQHTTTLRDTVVATGGGGVLLPENRMLLRQTGLCVFLDTPLEILEKRLRGTRSPLFSRATVAELHRERLPLYLETAHIRLCPAPGETPPMVAARVKAAIQDMCHGQ